MNRVKMFWIIVLGLFAGGSVFFMGYKAGRQPKDSETQARYDVYQVATKYNQLYEMCEEKYQLGIKGNFQDAYTLKGQMNGILQEIDTILSKY